MAACDCSAAPCTSSCRGTRFDVPVDAAKSVPSFRACRQSLENSFKVRKSLRQSAFALQLAQHTANLDSASLEFHVLLCEYPQ